MVTRGMRHVGAIAVAVLASTLSGQATQQATPATGTFNVPATVAPAAREAMLRGMDAYWNWSFAIADEEFTKALAVDSTLGLARVMRAELRAQPAAWATAEYQKAVALAWRDPVPALTYMLGKRAAGVNASRLLYAAMGMYPNDPRIATDFAFSLTGRPRLDSLRAVVQRFPTFAPVRAMLSYALIPETNVGVDSLVAESMAAAREAIRLAPQNPAGHSALARALAKNGQHAEAAQHARAALALDPRQEYAHIALAEVAAHDVADPRRFDRARRALDSASKSSPNPARALELRRTAAQLLLQDGKLDQMTSEFIAIAKEAEGLGAVGFASVTYLRLATLAGGAGASAATINGYLAEAKRLVPTTPNADLELYLFGNALTKQGAPARAALDAYLAIPANATNANRFCHTGLVLNAEGKYAEALESAGRNELLGSYWCAVAKMDAQLGLKKPAEAEAVRKAFLGSVVGENWSLVVAIMTYRGLKK